MSYKDAEREPRDSDVAFQSTDTTELGDRQKRDIEDAVSEEFQEYYGNHKGIGGDVRFLNHLVHNETWNVISPKARSLYMHLRTKAVWKTKTEMVERNTISAAKEYDKLSPWYVIPEHNANSWTAKALKTKRGGLERAYLELLHVGLVRRRYARLKRGYGWYTVVYETIDPDRCTRPDTKAWKRIVELEKKVPWPIRNGQKQGGRRFERWCRDERTGKDVPELTVK